MPVLVRLWYGVLCTAVLFMLVTRSVQAQTTPDPPISDNSFLIEEAYNQEAGVVQHIFNYRRDRSGEWLATFTQEWPLGGQLDQLSYTLPLQSAIGSGAAIGDAAINYRRQLLGHDDDPVWFAPRLSLVLPSGSARKGTGIGGPGLQLNLPLSLRVNRALVTHWNAGAAIAHARNALGTRATVRAVAVGASAIWLAAPTLNMEQRPPDAIGSGALTSYSLLVIADTGALSDVQYAIAVTVKQTFAGPNRFDRTR